MNEGLLFLFFRDCQELVTLFGHPNFVIGLQTDALINCT